MYQSDSDQYCKILCRCFSRVNHVHVLTIHIFQCTFGYAGNGYLCLSDPDNDGHPDTGISCAERGCKRVGII